MINERTAPNKNKSVSRDHRFEFPLNNYHVPKLHRVVHISLQENKTKCAQSLLKHLCSEEIVNTYREGPGVSYQVSGKIWRERGPNSNRQKVPGTSRQVSDIANTYAKRELYIQGLIHTEFFFKCFPYTINLYVISAQTIMDNAKVASRSLREICIASLVFANASGASTPRCQVSGCQIAKCQVTKVAVRNHWNRFKFFINILRRCASFQEVARVAMHSVSWRNCFWYITLNDRLQFSGGTREAPGTRHQQPGMNRKPSISWHRPQSITAID